MSEKKEPGPEPEPGSVLPAADMTRLLDQLQEANSEMRGLHHAMRRVVHNLQGLETSIWRIMHEAENRADDPYSPEQWQELTGGRSAEISRAVTNTTLRNLVRKAEAAEDEDENRDRDRDGGENSDV